MRYGLAVLAFVFLSLIAFAADSREAEIVQIRMIHSEDAESHPENGTATLNSTSSYEIRLQVENAFYTAIYKPKWKWSFKPAELKPGDHVMVRIEGRNLYLKWHDHKEIKATIVSTEPQS